MEFQDGIRDVSLPCGKVVEQRENKLSIQFNREETSAFELIGSLSQGIGIKDVSIREENIETIVSRIYEAGIGTE